MHDFSNSKYKVKIEFFLSAFEDDPLLNYIQKEGWINELFSNEDSFIELIDLTLKYTNNQAANLLKLSSGQRILNLLNNKEIDFTSYIEPEKLGERYSHSATIMFKLKMIFFLLSKGLSNNEIGNVLGLTSPTAVINSPSQKDKTQDALNTAMVREIALETITPIYDMLMNFSEYHESVLAQIQQTTVQQLEYTEKAGELRNHLSVAEKDISFFEQRITDLTVTSASLQSNIDNFEQIKRLSKKTVELTNIKTAPVEKQGFFSRLFSKVESPTVDQETIELIDTAKIEDILTDEEMKTYASLLDSLETNNKELKLVYEYLGRAKERKTHIEGEIEELAKKSKPLKTLSYENSMKLQIEQLKQSLNIQNEELNSNQSIVRNENDNVVVLEASATTIDG